MSDRVPPALTLSQTSRFPDRIAAGVPSREPLPVQNETMAAWFLSRYVPATGTYFGFSGPVTRLLTLVRIHRFVHHACSTGRKKPGKAGSPKLPSSRINRAILNSPPVSMLGRGQQVVPLHRHL
jgi:hypothetical protein